MHPFYVFYNLLVSESQEVGMLLRYDHEGAILEKRPVAHNVGTTVHFSSLFQHLPVRLQVKSHFLLLFILSFILGVHEEPEERIFAPSRGAAGLCAHSLRHPLQYFSH